MLLIAILTALGILLECISTTVGMNRNCQLLMLETVPTSYDFPESQCVKLKGDQYSKIVITITSGTIVPLPNEIPALAGCVVLYPEEKENEAACEVFDEPNWNNIRFKVNQSTKLTIQAFLYGTIETATSTKVSPSTRPEIGISETNKDEEIKGRSPALSDLHIGLIVAAALLIAGAGVILFLLYSKKQKKLDRAKAGIIARHRVGTDGDPTYETIKDGAMSTKKPNSNVYQAIEIGDSEKQTVVNELYNNPNNL